MRRIAAANSAGRLMIAEIVAPEDVMAQRVEEIASGLTICGEDVDGSVSDETHWFDGAALAPRPEHADLLTETISAGAPLGGFPAGWPARLLLDGAVQAEGEIPASGTLVFGDPGLWVVEILETWALGPQRPRGYAITVTP